MCHLLEPSIELGQNITELQHWKQPSPTDFYLLFLAELVSFESYETNLFYSEKNPLNKDFRREIFFFYLFTYSTKSIKGIYKENLV